MKVHTQAASLLWALGSQQGATADSTLQELPAEERELGLVRPLPPPPDCPTSDEICFRFKGDMGSYCEKMRFSLDNPDPYPSFSAYHTLASVTYPGTDADLTHDFLNEPGAPIYPFVAYVNVRGCEIIQRTCMLDCSPGGPLPKPHPPLCDEIPCGAPLPTTSRPSTPPPTPSIVAPTPRPTTQRPTPRDVPPTPSCPSGDDIWFNFEGLAGACCETMSFYLSPPVPGTTYAYSLAGAGTDVPQHTNIGLTHTDNPTINRSNPNQNYLFVAKATAPGCPTVTNSCLLDCVPGGPGRSVSDPPYCGHGARRLQRRLACNGQGEHGV